jgi:alpha-ribazole phosphatase
MEFILIRHTRCDVAEGTCYGRLDVSLANTAAADIDQALSQAPPVNLIFSSPSRRCHTLALALAERDGCAIRVLPELQELDFGQWEGLRWSEIPRSKSEAWTTDPWHRAPPGGESELELSGRVKRAAAQLLQVARYKPAGEAAAGVQRIAVVSHGGPLRLLRCLLTRTPVTKRWSLSMECGQVVSVAYTPPSLTGQPESACPSSDP